MGWPTDAQIDQAAETLCRMAEVPGLDRGRAFFDPDLCRVQWFSPHWNTCGFEGMLDVVVYVPSAASYEDRGELFERCRYEVQEGLYGRSDTCHAHLRGWFEMGKERGENNSARLLAMTETLCDEVAERKWRERINEQWPPLSVVEGGK
jgi:hypothetical protein